MRLSHCEGYCAAPLCYIPCLPKPKDAGAAAAAATEDKPPPVQKVELAPAAEKNGEKTAVVVAAGPATQKSNLKKANWDGECAAKGNVKWLDLLGMDLAEVKEFEPSESGESLDEGDGAAAACVCVIQ